jgi:hypothetical protein
MPSDLYFYMTALPPLGELGTIPPISFDEMLSLFEDQPAYQQTIAIFFLQNDLTQREAFLSGEQQDVYPTILTPEQARNKAPLPEWLAEFTPTKSYRVQADTLWEAFYYYAQQLGEEQGNEFLQAWVSFEVGLRNTLASARAQRLGLNPADYLVAPELAADAVNFQPIVDEWSTARDPLAGLGVIVQARWRWLDENENWFAFSQEELAAYAARLVLLQTSHQLAEAEKKVEGRQASVGTFA